MGGDPQEKPRSKKGKFRLTARHLALTYAQCELDVKEVLESLQVKFGEVMYKYIISQESHKDGGKHIHVYAGLSKRINICRADYLDIEGYHGDYKAARGLKA